MLNETIQNPNNSNSSLAATGAALISSDMRRQIRQMHEVDGCTVEDISGIFSIPELIIQSILTPTTTTTTISTKNRSIDEPSEYEETLNRVRSIEDQLRDAESSAVQTLVELNETADSEGIRYNSAKTILEFRAGKLRPEKPNKHIGQGMTQDGFKSIVEQALKVYQDTQERLKNANAKVVEA